MNIFKITRLLEKGNKTQFDVPIQEQYAYMNSLGEPKDDIDRSYKQFLCQNYFVPLWKKWIWWIVGLLATPIAVLILFGKGRSIHFEERIDTIAENKGMDEIIPAALYEKYEINHKFWNAGFGLSVNDVKYIVKQILGWRQPYFVFKIVLLIAQYGPKITKYHPKHLIEHSEYSFGSSVITDYCHRRGVKHINVQHGEKLRYIRDSFFHYDECYVWDEHYVNIFKEMHAEPSQFKVAVPPSLCIDCKAHSNPSVYADYKYYLAANTEEDIKSIVVSMAFAKSEGKTVKYRIHPRYTDLNVLRKYVGDDEIELPKEVSILESISNMEYAVGSYTTVLLQAYLSGKKVLLDDVTFHYRYNQLKEYGYILAKDDIEKLSEKQRNNFNKA